MKRLFGNTGGLKAGQIQKLETIYRRKSLPQELITQPLLRDMCRLSQEIRRQIGVLINRQGEVTHVIVGDYQKLVIPDISEYRTASGRLRGLRCVHTHLDNTDITEDDLTDLSLLTLDLMAVATVRDNGEPHRIHVGHILPKGTSIQPFQFFRPLRPDQMDIGFMEFILALEDEFSQGVGAIETDPKKEHAILIGSGDLSRKKGEEPLDELKSLAESCGLFVVGVFRQRQRPDTHLPLGYGQIQKLSILALQKGGTMAIFDGELNPSQIRAITDRLELKVIDRTQLILDIFAQRAQSKEGKLQVELAQLKYLLPRLILKNTAMSRLTGGIGGRGPGETKLEINRRRARDRIAQLERALLQVRRHRHLQRSKRKKAGLPVISIIGYTNAGKSTLLNTLTHSHVLAESRLFATLDPSSRRLRLPAGTEVIITDTVGFIRDLPKELMIAFRATLEELEYADLLLHVIDVSHPNISERMESVDIILKELNLNRIPTIEVLNKKDLIEKDALGIIQQKYGGIPVSAVDRSTLSELIQQMETLVGKDSTKLVDMGNERIINASPYGFRVD
ncbi:MAG: GTPase HflX [Pseudomonadota bacterium]